VAILVAVFAAAGGYASPEAFSDGFTGAIGVSAVLALAGAFAGLAVPARDKASDVTSGHAVTAPDAATAR
jgi:hypothetical protein